MPLPALIIKIVFSGIENRTREHRYKSFSKMG
jgi:hypothetical protein